MENKENMLEEQKNDNKNEQSENLSPAPDTPPYEIKLWKRIYLFGVGLAGLQIIALIIGLIITFTFPKDLVNPVANLITYGVLFVALVAIIIFDLPKLLYHFKKWQPYVFGIVGAIVIVCFDMAYSAILNLFYKFTQSGNEESVRSIISYYPLSSILILGIVGPICEELTYRVGLFALARKWKRWFAYVITTVVFASIHIVPSLLSGGNPWNELANLPLYAFSGFAFSFLYDKWGFSSSVVAHIGNNLFVVVLQVIAKKLGIK